ncbi:MAG: DinB family protein [Bacteroidota bacterium]
MEATPALVGRLREVLLNGTWIANTNYQDQLRQVDWQQATQQVGHLNTIAHLTFHINYYLAGILDFFRGGELSIRDKYSFDLPPITSAAEWQALRAELLANAEAFAQHVESLSEEQLAAPFVKAEYGDYRRNIEGMIEHCYYHLGQIVIIRKLLSSN